MRHLHISEAFWINFFHYEFGWLSIIPSVETVIFQAEEYAMLPTNRYEELSLPFFNQFLVTLYIEESGQHLQLLEVKTKEKTALGWLDGHPMPHAFSWQEFQQIFAYLSKEYLPLDISALKIILAPYVGTTSKDHQLWAKMRYKHLLDIQPLLPIEYQYIVLQVYQKEVSKKLTPRDFTWSRNKEGYLMANGRQAYALRTLDSEQVNHVLIKRFFDSFDSIV